MNYDPVYGWVLTKEEYISAGFTKHQYDHGRTRGQIKTIGRSCRGRNAQIIFKELSEPVKNLIKQKLNLISEEQAMHMLDAKMMGADMTEFAIEVTAQSIKINTPYIIEELKAYINSNFHKYTPHYLKLGISGNSVLGYSKICALGTWIYNISMNIMATHQEKRDQNRAMRSLRSNLLTAVDSMDPFEVKIPTNDLRFAAWMEEIINKMNQGIPIEEIVEIKRKGNQNTSRLTHEQELFIASFYIFGNSLSIQQIYDKVVEIGRGSGWWRNKETNAYEPVSYGTIRNYILSNENSFAYSRQDPARFFNDRVAQFTRLYPVKINQGWGIDGTAHNENVFYKGKVKQFVYAIRVYDYASFRLLNTEITIGVNEPSELLIQAIKGAIKASGYLPAIIQCDKGPGYKGLEEYCNTVGIHLLPAGVGRARSKVIEPLIGQFDYLIGKFVKGWSGGNRTAMGPNAHPSEDYYKKGKSSARSAEIASQELRGALTDEWNHHIISEREGKPCGKTPAELWNERESETPQLPYLEMCRLIGNKHTIKLTNEGLKIQKDNYEYLYFPPINTDQERILADDIFAKIPRNKKESSKLDLIILDYGKPAPVYQGTKFLGVWDLKKRVPYFATFDKNTDEYNKMQALQRLQIDNARNMINGIKTEMEHHPGTELFKAIAQQSLTGKKRVTGQLDKEELNASEIMYKAGINTPDPVETFNNEINQPELRRVVDPETGEVFFIPMNNFNQNQ